jgi:hypothetical protein
MREVRYAPHDLTRFYAQTPRYYGYTPMDWFKFYGFIVGMLFYVVFTYTHYFELFDDIEKQSAGYRLFVTLFSSVPLLLVLPAVLGFFWWAAGALVRYSQWQEYEPKLWRWFWFVMFSFYAVIEFDPLDSIHPLMSRKGLAPAPNLLKLYDLDLLHPRTWKLEFYQFQWGYFLLWTLFWFLLLILHWSYVLNGIRIVWFYTKRFNRYGASILTGFRETMAVARSAPATVPYPQQRVALPQRFRGVPRLAIEQLAPEQALAIVAADRSGAIVPAPGQPGVLFVDLGVFDYDPALAELRDAAGQPLLEFTDHWAMPCARREELVLPLRRPRVQPPHGGEGTA